MESSFPSKMDKKLVFFFISGFGLIKCGVGQKEKKLVLGAGLGGREKNC